MPGRPSAPWEALSLVDQGDGHIVYVGAGGTGPDETVYRVQGVIGVVIPQNVRDVDALTQEGVEGAAVRVPARRVRGPVGAIGAHADQRGVPDAPQLLRCGQGDLLVAAPPGRCR